ncbi:hypothetical protein [Pseudoduganella sp. R-43]|uniref:hypothetical protein n=1 Tax=Pseudoduganella sp. R-43 TaxID=3404063 RepID=UPI003CF3E401
MKIQAHLTFLLACLAASPASAVSTAANETLLVFDHSHLIATISNKGIRGSFSMTHQVLHFSCSFLFKETGRRANSPIVINSFPIQDGSKEDDIPGRVWEKNGEWIIQTDEPQAGCGSAAGTFDKGPDDDHPTRYTILKKMPAIGIRVVLRTTKLNDKDGGTIKERKGLLVAGDVVAALEGDDSYTRIRYVHPATARTTTAWVRTQDLGNPFTETRNMDQSGPVNFDKMDPRELPTTVPMSPEQREHLTLITQTMREVIENKRPLQESDPVFGEGRYFWPKKPGAPIKTALWFGVENFGFRSISVDFHRKTPKSTWESATLSVHPRNFPIGVYSMGLPKTFFADLVSTGSFPEKREHEPVTNVNVFEFALQRNANIKFRFEARPDVSSVSEKYPRSFHALTISASHDKTEAVFNRIGIQN